MLVPLGRAPTWRLHTKLYKFGWNTLPNNVRMKNRTDLNLGEVVYVSIIYHNPDSWVNLLNGYDFYFWLRDSANREYFSGGKWKLRFTIDPWYAPQQDWSLVHFLNWYSQSLAWSRQVMIRRDWYEILVGKGRVRNWGGSAGENSKD